MERPLALVFALGLAAAGATAPEGGPAVAEGQLRYHRDAEALERATLGVTRAILRGEPQTARQELDRMAELAPPLAPEPPAGLSAAMVAGDRSLQITLVNSREYATAGNLEELFNEFVWVQRTCLHCHGTARPRD